MTRAWRIVMRRVLEHCDDKYMEHCDYMGHGAFDDMFIEHCDDKGHGSLLLQGSWSIVMTRAESL